jgi:two-component system NtrC family sensor kinase
MAVWITRVKAFLEDLPLRPTIGAALIVGLAIPAFLVAWREVGERRQTLFDNLARDHARIVETLANGMRTPIWDVRPDTGRPLIDVIMGDSRVTAVSVTSPVLPEALEATRPAAGSEGTIALEQDVIRNDRQIGRVRVEMTTAPLETEAAQQGRQAFVIAMLQMAFGLLLIFPLVRFKVLAPLQRLVGQSQELASGKLEAPFSWDRRDELGSLGRSFDNTRRSLQSLFRNVEQSNAELRRREEALRDSEELHRLLVDLSPDGIMLHDDSGILFMNPAGCRALGASGPEVAVGRRYVDFVTTPDRKRSEERLTRVLEGESLEPSERRLVTLDGREIVVATSGVPFRRGDQRLALIIFSDITAMKRAEEEIVRQREALHQAEKINSFGTLLAGVAHELNNPLSVVVGRAIMLEEAQLDPPVATVIAKIRAAAERCARVVKTFLAMARQQAPSRVPARIDELIESSLDLLTYGLNSAGIKVINDLPTDLPETMADRDQLVQVFNNLITNAKQAMVGWNGPRELRISAAYDRACNQIRITIHDTGPGIPEDLRRRIFDPFFTTKPEGSGTGIGLAVCQGFVEAHGGTITAETIESGGASFVVALPVVRPNVTAMDEELRTTAAPATSRVLIVDDEQDIRAMLCEILSMDGHLVGEAANGREALALLAEHSFDLVISDLIMPVLDGPGLYDEMRRRNPRMSEHLIFITGDTLSASVQEFLNRAGQRVIEKPFIPDDVRTAVRDALDDVHAQRRPAEDDRN